jgi:hypothetical protein
MLAELWYEPIGYMEENKPTPPKILPGSPSCSAILGVQNLTSDISTNKSLDKVGIPRQLMWEYGYVTTVKSLQIRLRLAV